MHEMAITLNIIEIVKNEMAKNRVARIDSLKVRVGEMTAVEPDSLRFCFESCIQGTSLEGAVLDIEEVPLTGKCGVCRNHFKMDDYFLSTCPHCGGKAADIVSGRELDIVSMEVN